MKKDSNVYLDTSVLAAYYTPEINSDQVAKVLVNMQAPALSQLSEIELASAVSRKIRENCLDKSEGEKILDLFNHHLYQNYFYRISIEQNHFKIAKDWIANFKTPLRTLDALHLSLAYLSKRSLMTSDRLLAESAKALGIDCIYISTKI